MATAAAGCILCGADLVYLLQPKDMICENCGKTVSANACCTAGHYICDDCHSAPAFAEISQFCLQTKLADPLVLAEKLMALPHVKMHGPEHHYLVPAALLTAVAQSGVPLDLGAVLQLAKGRARNVPGGFCGLYGACGAAVGTGIFVSVFLGATPISGEEWGLANRMTAAALTAIGACGGPRCCKRDTRLAIAAAVAFANREMGLQLPVAKLIVCPYLDQNRECKKTTCPYYPK